MAEVERAPAEGGGLSAACERLQALVAAVRPPAEALRAACAAPLQARPCKPWARYRVWVCGCASCQYFQTGWLLSTHTARPGAGVLAGAPCSVLPGSESFPGACASCTLLFCDWERMYTLLTSLG